MAKQMTALRDFERGGKPVQAGESFMARPAEMIVRRKRGEAELSTRVPPQDGTAYEAGDVMTFVASKAVEAAQAQQPPSTGRRRKYRRRDLEPSERADLAAEG